MGDNSLAPKKGFVYGWIRTLKSTRGEVIDVFENKIKYGSGV